MAKGKTSSHAPLASGGIINGSINLVGSGAETIMPLGNFYAPTTATAMPVTNLQWQQTTSNSTYCSAAQALSIT